MRRVAILAVAAVLTTAAPATAHTLVRGSHGSAVRAVQRQLGLTADGTYGPQTARAVRAFQRSHGLAATGRVNARTRAALFAPAAPTPSPAASPTPATTTGGADADASTTSPTPATAPGTVTAMVAAARSVIGSPYKVASDGPDAFDCSGLVVWAAAQAGISDLPRASFDQYKTGTAVTPGDVVAGDLVFFDTGGPGPSDVGIASGPDTVISATTHGVREHPLGGTYWGAHYVGARRID